MAVSYRDGAKVVDGVGVRPVGRQTFPSSDGYTLYTATLWEDGERSCNCPGWSFRRKCKHAGQVRPGFEGQPAPRAEVHTPRNYARRIVLD